jgi:hypothetical protein
MNDLYVCIRAKAISISEPDHAREILRENRRIKENSLSSHVWEFRKEPPKHIFPKPKTSFFMKEENKENKV